MLKNSVKVILIALALIIITTISVLALLDPNDFREDIERQASNTIGLNLQVEGEISWSFIPIGININQISIRDQNNQLFSQFKNLTLQIDTLSLLKLSPKVNTLHLDGFELELAKEKDGQANWENLISDQTPPEKNAPYKESKQDDTAGSPPQSQLDFLVEQVRISNSSLHFVDQQTNQELNIEALNLTLTDIALERDVPLNLDFHLVNKAPQIDIKQNLKATLNISSDRSRIAVQLLDSLTTLTSELIKGKSVDVQMSGAINVDTKKEQIQIDQLSVALAKVNTLSQFQISNYSTQANILGQTEVQAFSLQELLVALGQAPLVTKEAQALSALALKSQIQLTGDTLSLPAFDIRVDQSSWSGMLDFNLKTQAMTADITGDSIRLDNYLPPKRDADAPPTASANPSASETTGEEALLPLETLRKLDLNIRLQQQQLNFNEMPFENIDVALVAQNGLITLKQANTKLYDGQIATSASLNASSDKVLWQLKADVAELNLLEHLGQTEVLGFQLGGTGDINLSTRFASQGNSLNTLKEFVTATAQLHIKDGAITGVNLNKLACQGFASLGGKTITKSDWPNETKFKALEAEVAIDGALITSKNLRIENIGLRAVGNGTANLNQQQLAYELDLTPIGDLGDDACIVREKVKGIAIPIKCEGAFSAAPASLCGLNSKKMGRIIEKFAKQEAERKIEKEVDRALDKKLDKYLDKDSELGNALKQGLKGLFK